MAFTIGRYGIKTLTSLGKLMGLFYGTSLLFVIGKLLIGLYLGNASVGSIYGTAGSLAVLLVWIYYSAQILFLGAEFTQVYANQYGSRIRPDAHAVALTERMRAQQGLTRTEQQRDAGECPQ